MSIEKLQPHNIDAEEATLGSVIIGGDIRTVNLKGDDFYSERNRMIFEACQRLVEKNVSINQITLAQELVDKGCLENIGGAAYLSHLIYICPTSLDLQYYADIVARMSFYRRLISASEQISTIGYNADSDINQSINKADEILLDLRKKVAPSKIISPTEKAQILLDRYVNLMNKDGNPALSTGIKNLDTLLGGGLYPGTLNIIGANTGMGKSTFLQNLANHIGNLGNVLYFSCEMSVVDLGDRDIAGIVQVPINMVRWGHYEGEIFNKIVESVGEIEKSNVFTYDETPITTSKILQASLNLKLRHGLVAIFVDYLGLLDDNYGENRNIILGNMTKRLKQIARQLEVPVVVAHQLSRDTNKRDDKRPVMSDLRESGHVEEDADCVIFVYRDNYFYDKRQWNNLFNKKGDNEYPEKITELIVAKQRQGGATGANKTVRVVFDDLKQKFFDLEDRYDENNQGEF